MPYFYLNGKPILPNNADCPAEVVRADIGDVPSYDFFIHGSRGHIEITGLTNKGYQLVSAGSYAPFDKCKEDVFNGKLFKNNVRQQYCKKGYAPLGTFLKEIGPGTYYIKRTSNGTVNLTDANSSVIQQLSSSAQNRKIFTIVLQAGGGSGSSGNGGWFGSNRDGSGGNGGGCIVVAVDVSTLGNLKLEVGYGGGGVGANTSEGNSGGNSSLYEGNTLLAVAYGGQGGKKESRRPNGQGGNNNTPNKIIKYWACTGGTGGVHGNYAGSGTSSQKCHIGIPQNADITIGGYSGGAGQSGYGGGGGASAFANGAAKNSDGGSRGSGGAGAYSNSNGTGGSGAGGNGLAQIYY